jgi:hypothetical protein
MARLGESFGPPIRLYSGDATRLRTFIVGKFAFKPGRYRLRATYDARLWDDEGGESEPLHRKGAQFYSNWQEIEKQRDYEWCDHDFGQEPPPRSRPRRDPKCDDPSLDEVDRVSLVCNPDALN